MVSKRPQSHNALAYAHMRSHTSACIQTLGCSVPALPYSPCLRWPGTSDLTTPVPWYGPADWIQARDDVVFGILTNLACALHTQIIASIHAKSLARWSWLESSLQMLLCCRCLALQVTSTSSLGGSPGAAGPCSRRGVRATHPHAYDHAHSFILGACKHVSKRTC